MEVWISFATVFLKFEKVIFFFFCSTDFLHPLYQSRNPQSVGFQRLFTHSSYATITSHTNQTISLFINSCFEQN